MVFSREEPCRIDEPTSAKQRTMTAMSSPAASITTGLARPIVTISGPESPKIREPIIPVHHQGDQTPAANGPDKLHRD